MAFYMTQKGGYMLDEDGMPAFNNDLGVEAVEYFLGLIEDDLVVPGSEAMMHGTNRELFCGEQTAVTIDGSFMKEICRATNPEIEMGFVHLEDVTGGHSTGGGFWAISAFTEHPEESWEFVKFLSSGETAKQYFLDSGQAPLMDVYDDPDIQADEFSRIAGEILKDPDTRVMPILPQSPELERILVEEIHQVMLEGKDVRQALDDAAAAWTEIIEAADS
jgi:multiple sugar transport system substrate-binding protein